MSNLEDLAERATTTRGRFAEWDERLTRPPRTRR